METKKQNIVIIASAVVISACIWIITLKNHPAQHFQSRVFKVEKGWGYDVLVNDTVVIHQESIPVYQQQQAFLQKEQAEKTARLIIQKLENGTRPTLTKFDLEKILGSNETNNDRQGKME
jgi:hypothetical protein